MNPDLTPELTGAQFEAKFAQVKNLKSMSTQSKPPLGNKPGTHRESSAELDRLRAENATIRAKLATGKPALAKPAANMTAEQWKAQNAPPTLTRAEWQKLDGGDRAKFFRNGGKLID